MVLLGTLYFASLRPGYSHISNTISELGETGAPQAHLVAFGFFLPVGVLVWLALWLTHLHRPSEDTSLVLLAPSGLGIGYVLSAFFPCDPGGPLFGSWRTLVHNTAGLIDYGGTAIGFLLFCRYCARHKMRPQAVSFGIAAVLGLLGFLAMVLLGFPPAFPVRGAVQRVTEVIQFTGVFFVCHLLSTRAATNKRPALDAGLQFGHQPPGASFGHITRKQMISFIVPAHNEEAWVGRCVSAIRVGLESLAEAHEIIVVDDGSSDATASIARQQGAQVIRVEHRQIAATRNAGARQARGDIFFFVDADTLVNAAAIQSALRSIRAGAVGGGCVPRFEGWLPWWFRLTEPFIEPAVRLARFLPSGTFLFCTRSAFQTTGGFDENYYAAEEVVFVAALKRQGQFAILAETVVTSGRKFRAYSSWTLARLFMRLVLRGPRGLRSRRGLEYWYEPEREKAKL